MLLHYRKRGIASASKVTSGALEVCSAMDGAAQALQGRTRGRPPKSH